MGKGLHRIPKNYDGKRPTGRLIRQLLPHVLHSIGRVYKERPDLVLLAWADLVGEKIAPMTQAISFREGILLVKVKNSTLLSLLVQYEKKRLLKQLRKKFPSTEILDIIFRIG